MYEYLFSSILQFKSVTVIVFKQNDVSSCIITIYSHILRITDKYFIQYLTHNFKNKNLMLRVLSVFFEENK